MGYIEELEWRGMVQDITPGTAEFLNNNKTVGYVGYDPTAPSLTVGNLTTVMLLVHFQRAGHKPVALVGGATGRIGDPSGKDEERKLLSEDLLNENVKQLESELGKLLDFDGPNGAVLVNNMEWFGQMTYLEFLRDIGKHMPVAYMLSKESVKRRLETGISYTEFSYQVLQAEDYYRLSKDPHNCQLQMGGSDQWGNITAGIEMIRRKAAGDEVAEAFGVTCPLITKADGTKFGKSEEGNIWLNREMTSPYKFYQFWLNASDEDAEKYIKIFTTLNQEEVNDLVGKHQAEPHVRMLQKELARIVTSTVHSEADYELAIKASGILFGNAPIDGLKELSDADLLTVFEGVPQVNVAKSQLEAGLGLLDFLSEGTGIFPSKGEARRLVTGGGLSINKEKVADIDLQVDANYLINDKYMLVQKGKRNYFLVVAA
jgi:tyrosyl-tRNA synthetase